jgi:hypothetical protein
VLRDAHAPHEHRLVSAVKHRGVRIHVRQRHARLGFEIVP